MSHNKKPKSINPIASISKNQKKGGKLKEDQLKDFIVHDSDISEEEHKPKMKRLKKVRADSSDEAEKLIDEEQEWNPSEEDEEQGGKFEKFEMADDDDLKKRQKEDEDKKKSKKLKGNQQLDKFMTQNPKPSKKSNAKPKRVQTQMSLASMFQAGSNAKKRKDSFEAQMANIELDGEDSDSDDEKLNKKKLLAYQTYNAGNTEQDAIKKACQESLAEMKQYKNVESYSFDYFNKGKEEPSNKELNHSRSVREQKPAEKKEKPKKQPRSKSAGKKKQNLAQNTTGPLSGKIIVMTGQFVPFSKAHLSELMASLGAQCPKSLTKKSTHLLQGAFVADNFGRKLDQDVRTTSKSREAETRGLTIIPFEQLDNFFIENTGKTVQELMEKDDKKESQKGIDKFIEIEKTGTKKSQMMEQDPIPISKPPSKMDLESTGSFLIPWTEKYKPTSLSEIIGQNSQIKNLKEWLESWEDIQIRGNKRDVKAAFNSFMPSGTINSKAALLSGDAGLGKTTTARLLAAHYNYGVVEFNASDARNKKSVQLIGVNKDNTWLSGAKTLEKTLLIMDQVDGMSSGDRGGITAIIDMIKKTKIPIICICNDRQATKIRSLAGHCYDIKFHKPDKRMLVKRMAQIVEREGGKSTEKGLQRIVQLLQNDVRQILTYLQMFFRTVSQNISYDTVDKNCNQPKDNSIMMNHFEASKKLMNRMLFRGMTISQRIDLTYVDSDMVPLMVQENYLTACQKKKMNRKDMHQLVKATEGFVSADLIDKKIQRTQQYSLMPGKMFLGCVYAPQQVCENLGFPKFTSWLGKFSTERKNKRLIKQLKNSLSTVIPISSSLSARDHYSTMLFEWIFQHLREKQPYIDSIVAFMDHYNINPNTLNENIASLQYGNRENLLKQIPAGTKAKLTRAYNKHHQSIKFKKQKTKTLAEIGSRYDPVLGQMENLRLDDDEDEAEQEKDSEEVLVVEKKGKGKKKK